MTSYPCGLTNLGNTCFLNSCVQLLNYTEELANVPSHTFDTLHLCSFKTPPQGAVMSEECVADCAFTSCAMRNGVTYDHVVFQEWRELRNLMMDARGQMSNPVATPGKFVKIIHDVARIKGRDLFTGWAQNDLPEFLLFMVECMHNSRKRAVKMNINGSSESDTDSLALQCYKMLKENYERGDYSEISDIFYGVYVSRLFTPNGSVLHSNKPESYFILDLPIPTSSQQTTLIDCFDVFVGDELLTGWINEKTNEKEPVRKNITFWSFPNILVITLKRYSSYGRNKNCTLIDFPLDNLDLSKYVVGYNASSYKYKLFGVANHMGGIMGGHYTAFVSIDGNKWYCCNDAEVTEIDHRIVVSSSAYCLFYRKK